MKFQNLLYFKISFLKRKIRCIGIISFLIIASFFVNIYAIIFYVNVKKAELGYKNKENKKWGKNRKNHKNLWFRDALYSHNRIFYFMTTKRNILYRFCFDFNYLSLRGHFRSQIWYAMWLKFPWIHSIYRMALTMRGHHRYFDHRYSFLSLSLFSISIEKVTARKERKWISVKCKSCVIRFKEDLLTFRNIVVLNISWG